MSRDTNKFDWIWNKTKIAKKSDSQLRYAIKICDIITHFFAFKHDAVSEVVNKSFMEAKTLVREEMWSRAKNGQ